MKFTPAGLPRFSTYLGGTGDDWGYAINADLAGNLWVGGSTSSLNFALVKPYQPFYAGGPFDAYVSKIAIPPVEAVAVLQAAVSNLVYEGLLSQQASHPLQAKLEHARNQLSEGDMEGATEQLQGFIRKAQHDLARGTLSPADGQRLSSAAADVLKRLGSGEH